MIEGDSACRYNLYKSIERKNNSEHNGNNKKTSTMKIMRTIRRTNTLGTMTKMRVIRKINTERAM